MPTLYFTRIPLVLALDCRDLFTSISTQLNSVDKSIHTDVNTLRHEFDRRAVSKNILIPEKENLSDPGTKS